VEWSYSLKGVETRYRIGEESRNSMAKWEGAALLINTLVSGPQDYTVMDRWKLSDDLSALSITRQIVRKSGTVEGLLVYRRMARAVRPTETAAATADAPPRPAALMRQMDPPAAEEFTILAGTHIPLSLRNSVDTKHSKEGDHIYLQTLMPIASNGRIVIPQGSYVTGVLTISKPAGKVKGKGELFIRFETLTLPNGTQRDFRSRLSSADSSAKGTVDQEGTMKGERDSHGDVPTVAGTTMGGAGIGAIATHTVKGAAVGGAVGAGAGIAAVLLSKRPEVVLRQGTEVEMLLDRDLRFSESELRRW
jgi:type IV secretion system protein VirB10